MPNSPKIQNVNSNPKFIIPTSSTNSPANSSPVNSNSNDIQHCRHTHTSVTSSNTSSSTDHVPATTQTPPPPPPPITRATANNNNKGELTDDGEPLYDSVASEDDYTYVEIHRKLEQQKAILAEQSKQLRESSMEGDSPPMESAVSVEEYFVMKEKLETSEARIQELQSNNAEMRSRLDELCSTVKSLREENVNLRSMYSSGSSGIGPPYHSKPAPSFFPHHKQYTLHNGDVDPAVNMRSACPSRCPSQRPFSMFEARQCPPNAAGPGYGTDQARTNSYQLKNVRVSGEYDNTRSRSPSLEPTETTPLNPSSSALPTQKEVIRKTEVITKRIQELLISAQEGRHDSFVPCADQIHSAVLDMDAIFPKSRCPPGVQGGLRQLVSSAVRLQKECIGHLSGQPNTLDPKFVTQQVIQCAYDIAKAAKLLVTHFQ
ncbi:glycerophosphoinositol permease [Halocaridina rubra]|uniref:Glycerophosphoinositol permease n=1 Tax=Halocaridina rubra TaxID=373956 RepID=A0AAN8ZX26_HALRR